MKKVFIKNIGHLVNCKSHDQPLQTLTNAWAVLEGPFIQEFGEMIEFPVITDLSNLAIIDADGQACMALHWDSRTYIPVDFEYGRFESIGLLNSAKIGQSIYEKSDFQQVI